ncbi:MAG: hypothetical protein IJW03_06195 [Clostridia bacterium]|nr:hypothetical protein [Clostridia bacterium]
MRRTMDSGNHAGRVVLFILILTIILGLFVYVHFIKGVHFHTSENNEWVVETAETCTEQGYRYKICKTCGISFNGQVLDALGHDFVDPIKENVVKESCTSGGSYDLVSYCSRCNAIGSEEHITVDILEHTPAAAVKENVVESTCTEVGTYELVVHCADCGYVISSEVKITLENGHTEASREENRTEATCTEDGSYNSVTYCTVCSDVLNEENVILPKTGHTASEAVVENLVEPNCTDTGSYESVIYCSVCSVDYSRVEVVIPAEGHDHSGELVLNQYTAEPELHTTCSKCDATNVIKSFSDSELTHVYVIEPTCTSTGTGKYIVDMDFEGCNITASCDTIEPKRAHALIAHDFDGNPYNIIDTAWNDYGEAGEIYGYRYDWDLNRKYYDVSTPGLRVVVDEEDGETYDSVWDENGYAYAAYKCSTCNSWFIVDVYNADYDTRIK